MQNLFVYGTLMRGQAAANKLEGYTFKGVFRLADYAMYNLGSYPGIKPCLGENVIGELYEIPTEAIEKLDMYEGEGSLYVREEVRISREGEETKAIVYVYNDDVDGFELMREPWNAEGRDYVWYAGYGSTLSEERFRCYVQGGTNPYNPRKSNVGCKDKTLWIDEQMRDYSGRLYFGNISSTWDNKGVAFFDPDRNGRGRYRDNVHMHLYKITREQLHDVQNQEGNLDNWYGRLYCLDVLKDNCPVYTLTSEKPVNEVEPSEVYANLILDSLIKHLGKNREFEIENYMSELSPGLSRMISDRLEAKRIAYERTHNLQSLQADDETSSSKMTTEELIKELEEMKSENHKLKEENRRLIETISKIRDIIN